MKFSKEADKLYSKLEEQEIEGKIHYYKKREVYPPLNKDGSIRWKNFLIGNWKSFSLVLLIVLITLGVIWEYVTNLQTGIACISRENLLKNLTRIIP